MKTLTERGFCQVKDLKCSQISYQQLDLYKMYSSSHHCVTNQDKELKLRLGISRNVLISDMNKK
jgi:hypothetical protein